MKPIIFITGLLFQLLAFGLQAQDTATAEAGDRAEEVKDVQYVTDKLRLSLYQEASASSKPLKLLTSGDRLEVLERKGPYSRVRTEDGKIGWVKNGFLINEPTAVTQLAEAEKRIAALQQDMEKYADSREVIARYEQRIAKLEQQKGELEQQLEQANATIVGLQEETENLRRELERSRSGELGWNDLWSLVKLYWILLVAISLLLGLIGFIAGKLWIERRIRSRFHGYRVW